MIHVISMWHNEEYLAPLFLKHYERADHITIILDDCTDNTRDLLNGCEVLEITTGGMDDIGKCELLSHIAMQSKARVRIVVDADEFIYSSPESGVDVLPGQIYSVGFWEVFRNKKDQDIDRDKYPLQQRLHGNTVRGQSFGQNHFVKPIVFGAGADVWLAPGNHYLMSDDEIIHDHFDGAHWAMAEPSLAIQRRGTKRLRMSQRNYQAGLASHDWHITSDQIMRDCIEMFDAPQVIYTKAEKF